LVEEVAKKEEPERIAQYIEKKKKKRAPSL